MHKERGQWVYAFVSSLSTERHFNMAKKTGKAPRQSKTWTPDKPAVKPSTKGLDAKMAKAVMEAHAAPTRSAFWKPEAPGEFIAGTLVGERTMKGKDGYKPQRILTMKTDAGVIEVPCNIVMANALEVFGEKIKPGVRLAIVYKGRSSGGKRGQPARLYSVALA